MVNLYQMDDLSNDEIHDVLQLAEQYKREERKQSFEGRTGALLFYEPSTRTKMSFDMACQKLNIPVLSFSEATSSVTKGESLYDTVKTVEAIGADFVVIRHPDANYFDQLTGINIPVINGGDGTGEHPTQCLLDLMTIKEQFQEFAGLTVTICGDIRHSRVARSNAFALNRLGVHVKLSAPEAWQDDTLPFPYQSIDDAVKDSDVMMLLRVQAERHDSPVSFDHYLTSYGLTIERAERMRTNSMILHPAPVNRGVEIDSKLVESKKSFIFKQMENGVYVRQAVIDLLLNQGGIHNEKTD
ncbi:aspartate carbamoyltransferase catalytic subunit [Alkalibacillus sp. S2W]|uniref:aspartate carbamoyltransferase catalytic subunit n=1 Tax=Alkalibacillus sp. S2W TaxID=3386553 RepID=UPI00398CC4F3